MAYTYRACPWRWPAAALLLSGCANPSVGSSTDDPNAPVTLKFWHGWSTPTEVKAIDDSIARFEKLHTNIKVVSTGNVGDETINQALRAGGTFAPDVVSSFTTNNVGQYCSSGMWADLDPFMKKTGIDKAKVFPRTLLDYTQYEGAQCALPLLADAYGMYYNKDAFKEAGISRPPRTISELKTDAVELTREEQGRLAQAGRLHAQLPALPEQPRPDVRPVGADVLRRRTARRSSPTSRKPRSSSGRMRASTDAQGGYAALEKLRAAFGDEMSDANAFLTGKVAMHLDGEWRGLMLKDAKAPFGWGVAPLPVPDDQADTYGRGYLTGTVTGIAHSSTHQNAAWELVKYPDDGHRPGRQVRQRHP